MATATATPPKAASLDFGLRKQRSLWSDAWRRLRGNKAAVVSLFFILLLIIVSTFGPLLSPHRNLKLVANNKYRYPFWSTTANGRPIPQAQAPASSYPLGTDALGRDTATKLMYGGRVSLLVGLVPTLITLTIGTTIGMISGFFGGRTDSFMMRLTDIVYAFPDLLFIIIVMSAFRDTALGQALGGLLLLFIALSITAWTGVARLIRGQVLSLKEKEFVEAARAVGVSRAAIMARHLFPNVLSLLIVSLTFGIPGAIIGEAALGFLGIGARPPSPGTPSQFPTTWGVMLQEGASSLNSNIWMLLFSAGIIAIVTVSFTFIGDGMRDALDPRQQK